MALFLPSLVGGGAERITLNLATGLLELGHAVDLVLFTATGELSDSVPAGVRVVDLRCGRALRAPVPLARYLRREKPDLLIGTMGHTNLAALLGRWLARTRTQLVLTEHLAVPPMPPGFRDRVYRVLARRVYSRADAVVAVSQGVADSMVEHLRLPPSMVKVIYNPVLTERFWQVVAEPPRHPWFAPGEPPVVIGVGRLVPQKDFPTLIRAFQQVVKERPARLLILGEGPDRAALAALAEELGLGEAVGLPGFLDNPYSLMAHAGVFALSSIREGLPTVLIEALASGVPVVSTDCESGPMEILDGGRLGKLVPVGDARALAAAIQAALEGPRRPPDEAALARYTPRAAALEYLTAAGHRD